MKKWAFLLVALLYGPCFAATVVEESELEFGSDFGGSSPATSALPWASTPQANTIVMYAWRNAIPAGIANLTIRDQQGNAYTRYIPSTPDSKQGAWFIRSGFSADQTGFSFEWSDGGVELLALDAYELSHGGALTYITSFSAAGTGTSALATITTTTDNLIAIGRLQNNSGAGMTAAGTGSNIVVDPSGVGRETHHLYSLDLGTADNPTIGGTSSSTTWGVNGIVLQEGGGGGASIVPLIMQMSANDPVYRIPALLARSR